MSGKIMIVGTGNVGTSIAFALLNQQTPVKELILTDINHADAEGEVMDLCDALAVAPSWIKIRAGHYAEAKDCDICILTAGANQKPGESRTDLLAQNAKITKDIVTEVMASGFRGIFIVVSNPMDALTALVHKVSGLPPEQIIGSGTILDSARLRFKIAEVLEVHPKSVHAYQIGEHGDSEVTLWSNASVGGEKLLDVLPERTRERIETFVKKEAYEIIAKKGATHFGIGACTVQIVSCILGDERRILPVSSYDDCTDTFNGFPTIIGKGGVVRRIELSITEAEAINFQKSINAIKRTIKQIKV